MPQIEKKHFGRRSPHIDDTATAKRPYLSIAPRAWTEIVVFLLSMAALGLEFPPALPVVLLLMFKSFITNRYEFIIQMTLFFGGYGLHDSSSLPVHNSITIFVVILILLLINRKPPVVKRTFLIFGIFLGAILILINFSDLSFMSQVSRTRFYLFFLYFYLPLLAFDNLKFDMGRFMTMVMGYTIVLAAFYIIDSIVLCSHILIPRVFDYDLIVSKWDKLHIFPFQKLFRRIYPPGMYLTTLAIFGFTHILRLRKAHIVIIVLGLSCTKTITFFFGLICAYIFLQKSARKIIKYSFLSLLTIISLYFVDVELEKTRQFNTHDTESPLRIRSTITQITEAAAAKTEEELASLGSGRMAQAIPKFELLYKYHKQWTGFGFLDRNKTTDHRYIIDNELYQSVSQQSEVATGVEIAYAQTILDIGYLGLIAQIITYVVITLSIRRLRYFRLYMSVLLAVIIYGIGGYCSINNMEGQLLLGLAYAAVLLSNRDVLPGFNTSWLSQSEKWRRRRDFNSGKLNLRQTENQ